MADWPYNTTAWKRLRRAKLAEKPLCEDCHARGRLTVASHVDHRVAINRGGPAFPSLDALASLCPSCHSRKTNAEDMPNRLRKGCDANGFPLDAAHPFVSEASPGAPQSPAGQQETGAGTRDRELVDLGGPADPESAETTSKVEGHWGR